MKTTTRANLIKTLQAEFPGMQCRLGEDFSPEYKGSIWTGEDAPSVDGNAMFSSYSHDIDPHETIWVMGVHRRLQAILDRAGWMAEFHDAGTVFIFAN